MAIIRKWSGDAIDGFDSELSQISDSMVYASGAGVTYLNMTGTGSRLIGWAGLPALVGHAGRATVQFSAWAASSQVIAAPLDGGGNASYRILLTSTGTIQVNNNANAYAGATFVPMTLGQTYRIEWWANLTDMEVRVYTAAGTLHDTATLTAKLFSEVSNFRFGQSNASPDIPTWRIYDLALSDTYAQIGPKAASPAANASYHRVGILGDSLTSMSGANGQYVLAALTTAGHPTQNVYLWGVGGKRIVPDDLTGRASAQNIADAQVQLGGAIDHWVIALGTNDRPQVDAVVNADIDTLLTAIGAGPKVTWINLTSKATASTDDIRLNGLIAAKLSARGNATLVNWNGRIRSIDGGANPSPYWLTTDTTHMTALGYQQRAGFYVEQLQGATMAGEYDFELVASLNRLAGTTGLSVNEAANAWAGTTNMDLAEALNVKAGTTGLSVTEALNVLAATTGLNAIEAAWRIV